MSSFHPFNRFLWLLPAALCLGCADSGGLDKVTVEGTVTYNGNPVQNGEIRFVPIEGTQGPVSGAPIVEGRYEAIAKGGVPVGKHTVQIEGYDTKGGGESQDMISGGRTGARVNYIPAKYHRESQLTLQVSGDKSSMNHDFNLDK